jgi:dihydrofolate synthase/folylpolyglutamate synthase
MQVKSLSDWLSWQGGLHPSEIDLGLERIRIVAARLPLQIPRGHIFVVAGTNGKGTSATLLATLLTAAGLRTGLYTSPHLVHYNERVAINGRHSSDEELVAAFEAIEAVRGDTPLTYFEFGTLAALMVFSAHQCEAWVLEVGLGGRLDAVNAVGGDFNIITTVDYDHQQWLGNTIEEIAAEKAGIIGSHSSAFFGDVHVPVAITDRAAAVGAPLACLWQQFSYVRNTDSWDWKGATTSITNLPFPAGRGEEQLRNISVVLAALEAYKPAVLANHERLKSLIGALQLPGRFQIVSNQHEWILDVAHNPQSARALYAQLQYRGLPDSKPCTIVLGMLADKHAAEFAEPLATLASLWITCPTAGSRGCDPEVLRQRISGVVHGPILAERSVTTALERARKDTPVGGRIIICGSFLTVGPALEWLGLY